MPASVRDWLRSLGLEAFFPQFDAEGIDLESLPLLSDNHLREMGVPIGPRVKLLAAVGRLGTGETASPSVERRRITVMFADLVASTSLSTRLDPEEMHEVIRLFHGAVESEAAHHAGFVAQFLGDGALVYFGYPRAHEDDPERGVRAALGIVRAVAKLRAPSNIPLAAHIGIANGVTVVGDTFGRIASRERSAVGETPNLAARLAKLAGEGQVVVSAEAHSLTRHQFDFESLGSVSLDGLDSPVGAYRVISELPVETRFGSRHVGTALPMVGRDREFSALLDCWNRASRREGHAVLVSGEAGIGKSRLVHALDHFLRGQPYVRISNQCSPHHVGTALFPMARQIARAANLDPDDEAAVQMDKLAALVEGASSTDLALTALLVGVDVATLGVSLDMTPTQRRHQTFQALLRHLQRTAEKQPVLWLLEDAHWIDPTSLELMELFIDRLADLPILVVVTFRPEFVERLAALSRLKRIELTRLSAEDARTLMHNVSGGKRLPVSVVSEIAARTDGIPLFVEELTKSVLDAGELIDRGEAYVLADDYGRLAVPASLHDSLMSRLDRHRTQKEVAQVASCIGREFHRSLLEQVAGLPPDALGLVLNRLRDAELLFEQGRPGDGHYAFKHALVRDAAYESLLRRRREELHARILGALRKSPETPAEVLASHAGSAGLAEQAIDLWTQAGASALARSAFAEAVSHLQQAVKLSEGPVDDKTRAGRRLELLMALGQATVPLRGYSHDASVEVFERAHRLAQRLGDAVRAFWVSYARWVVYYVRGEHTIAHDIARAMVAQADTDGHDGRSLTALRTLGISEMMSGVPLMARATFGRASALASRMAQQPRERRMAVAQRFAADPEIATQFHVALTEWALGEVDQARGMAEESIRAARAVGHVHTLGHALTHGAIVAVIDGNAERAVDLCEETASLSEKHDMELWRGYGSILHGFAWALRDEPARSLDLLNAGLQRLARTQTNTMVPLHHSICAWSLCRLGRFEEARPHERHALLELNEGSQRYWWVESLVWLGQSRLLQTDGSEAEAEDFFQRAVAEARRQSAPGWELRAATELGRLWLGRGEAEKAAGLLSPSLARFVHVANSQRFRDAQAVMEAALLQG